MVGNFPSHPDPPPPNDAAVTDVRIFFLEKLITKRQTRTQALQLHNLCRATLKG